MTCEGGADGYFSSFGISDFSHHDHIRVLPEDRSERGGERETDIRADVRLVDAEEIVFDWIFDRRDIHLR